MERKEVPGMKFKADIVGKRKFFYIVSVVLLLAGVVSMLFQGLNLGIDFTSGNKMIVQFDETVNIADLRNAIGEQGIAGSKIQELDNGSYVLKTPELTQEAEEALVNALEAKFGALTVQSSGAVNNYYIAAKLIGCHVLAYFAKASQGYNFKFWYHILSFPFKLICIYFRKKLHFSSALYGSAERGVICKFKI